MSNSQIAREIEGTFRQFLYLPNEHTFTVSTLWVMHTHLRDVEGRFLPYITPRICYLSKQAGAGKTTALEITTHLSHNGEMVVEPTQPSAVSLIDGRATLGLDEIDLYFGRGSTKAGMRTILNSGYKRGASVTYRRNDEPVRSNIHAPIAMAGKNATAFMTLEKFETLRTRTHCIIMEPRPRNSEVEYYDEEIHLPNIRTISEGLKRWGLKNGRSICASSPPMPEEIYNRNREIWKVLFQIAHHLEGEWPSRCESAARAFVLGEHDDTSTPIEMPADELLRWVRAVFADTEECLPSIEIVGRLLDLPGEHWWTREWTSERVATMSLARQLKIHEIEHSKLYIDGATPWGYRRADLGMPPAVKPAEL